MCLCVLSECICLTVCVCECLCVCICVWLVSKMAMSWEVSSLTGGHNISHISLTHFHLFYDGKVSSIHVSHFS